jgi:hypothetical protein
MDGSGARRRRRARRRAGRSAVVCVRAAEDGDAAVGYNMYIYVCVLRWADK